MAIEKQYIETLKWGLVQLTGKKPIANDWPNNPITDVSKLKSGNIGLNHGYSKTCVLDIDHIATEYALSVVKIDLRAILAATPYKIIGNPNNPPKPLFKLPSGIDLTTKQLRWPDPDGRTNSNGSPKMVTIFELRGGPGFQDVLPPSIHPDTKEPYTWLEGPPSTPDDIPAIPQDLLAVWLTWDIQERKLKDGCPWVESPTRLISPQPQRALVYNNSDFDVTIVQTQFNDRYTPGDVLEKHGYITRGKKWLCPNSDTGNPGVIPLGNGEKILSYHGSDPLSDGHPHDAYDCYVILEHSGDRKKAWRAAKKELDISFERIGQEHKNHNDNTPTLPQNDLVYHEAVTPHLDFILNQWGLTGETVSNFKIGYCEVCPTSPYSASFTVPYYQAGDLVDIRHRLLSPNGQGTYRPEVEGCPPHLFNLSAVGLEDWIILVNREFNAMLLGQVDLPTVGLPSTFKRSWLSSLKDQKKVFIALDPGQERAARMIGRLLVGAGVDARICSLPFSPRDMLVKYGCGLGEFCVFIEQGWGV